MDLAFILTIDWVSYSRSWEWSKHHSVPWADHEPYLCLKNSTWRQESLFKSAQKDTGRTGTQQLSCSHFHPSMELSRISPNEGQVSSWPSETQLWALRSTSYLPVHRNNKENHTWKLWPKWISLFFSFWITPWMNSDLFTFLWGKPFYRQNSQKCFRISE